MPINIPDGWMTTKEIFDRDDLLELYAKAYDIRDQLLDNTEIKQSIDRLSTSVSRSIKIEPIQLYFSLKNELHHKPKKKKLKVEYICQAAI